MYTRMFKFGMLRTYFFHNSVFQIKKKEKVRSTIKLEKI